MVHKKQSESLGGEIQSNVYFIRVLRFIDLFQVTILSSRKSGRINNFNHTVKETRQSGGLKRRTKYPYLWPLAIFGLPIFGSMLSRRAPTLGSTWDEDDIHECL